MKKRIFTILWISIIIFGCTTSDKVAEAVSKINVDLQIARFDQEFSNSGGDIAPLRAKYPYLFPAADSVWKAKLADPIQIELREEVAREFPDFDKEAVDLELLFKHIKYYFPKLDVPKVMTVTNDVDHENRIILADSLLFIGLDNYLGPNHKFYVEFQNYVAINLDRQFMISDVAGEFAKKIVPGPRDRSFISRAIYYGKQLYLKDKIIPFLSDAQKIGYSEEQLQWALTNEEPIWRYFVERELLYDTDRKLAQRFLNLAPFSKFGLELDNESPGRVGRYLGWQIVRAFMNNNTISLSQLMNLPGEEIFKKSNYKPKK
ncbi:MAG: gliding motility lipoprotein GldB [Flavobacteriaceae bacterium]